MSDLPGELADPDAPPGTSRAAQVAKTAAPVWCVHGVSWRPTGHGYIADDANIGPHHGHDDPAQDPGAIPCQPTYASEAAWRALAVVREHMPE